MTAATDSSPKLVKRALQLAEGHGFKHSCLPEVGQLLRILVGLKQGAKIAEIGTGFGVGSAWITSGMQHDSTLYTVEYEPERAESVRTLFADVKNIHVISGDWKLALPQGPFDFVFVDAKPAKFEEADILINAVSMNGVIVLDDFTPLEFWPEEWKGKPDVVRDRWHTDERLVCMELRTSQRNAVLVARRVQ